MIRKKIASHALRAAVVGISVLSYALPHLRADSTWIDPSDGAGVGNDPSAGVHLNGTYESAGHWNPPGVPGSAANVLFNAPGYPSTPYTVTFNVDEQANRATISNPVTFDLTGHTYILTANGTSSSTASLIINNQKSLTLGNGTIDAQSALVGTASTLSPLTALTVDGSGGPTSLIVASNQTLFNYQSIQVVHGGVLSIGDQATLDQAPDLAGGGFNTASTVMDSSGLLVLGDGATLRGGTVRFLNGGGVAVSGTSLNFDSVYYDLGLSLISDNFTMNITSSLHDPNDSNAVVATTITGGIYVDALVNLNITAATLLLTPDSGATWRDFTTVGNTQTTISDSTVTVRHLNFDGDGAPGTFATQMVHNSTLNVHGDFFVGNLGNGVATIDSGSIVNVDGALVLGNFPDGAGTLTLSGAGSLLTTGLDSAQSNFAFGDVIVGSSGAGLMTVDSGASVTVANGFSVFLGNVDNGNSTGGNGTLTITGGAINGVLPSIQSTLDVYSGGGSVYLGWSNATYGELDITNGGYVRTNETHVGEAAGSTGVLALDGGFFNPAINSVALSQLNNFGDAYVGNYGTGSLTLANSAVADIGGNLYIGKQLGGWGAVSVDTNGEIDVNLSSAVGGQLVIAGAGVGALQLFNSGVASVIGNLIVGDSASSLGNLSLLTAATAIVMQNPSDLDNSGYLIVGNNGQGTMEIFDASSVSDTVGQIATGVGSKGSVIVDASEWDNAQNLEVADYGNGTLTIQNSGTVLASDVNVGFYPGSKGSIIVTGSLLQSFGFLQIGSGGTGTMTITNGGVVGNNFGGIAHDPGSVGVVIVDGAGSAWVNGLDLVVGGGGDGSLSISNGGTVTVLQNMQIAAVAGSTGAVTVNNATLTVQQSLTMGSGGAGTLTIGAGGTVSAATSTVVGAAGVVNMQGGTFTTPTIALNGLLKGNGTVFGAIAGSGTLEADSPAPLTTDSFRVSALVVSANAAEVIRSNNAYSKINTLSIAHAGNGSSAVYSGVLQLNNNRLVLQTADSASKAAAILAINEALFAGHNGTLNSWSTTKGITSAAVAADPQHLTIGVYDNAALHSLSNGSLPRTNWAGGTANVDTNSLLITPALKGDANLDGLIDIADMVVIANNWNKSGLQNGISTIDMAHGDVNQDGVVDIADMVVVANNWNQTSTFNRAADLTDPVFSTSPASNAPAPVPEPASMGLLLAAIPLLRKRRSRVARSQPGRLP